MRRGGRHLPIAARLAWWSMTLLAGLFLVPACPAQARADGVDGGSPPPSVTTAIYYGRDLPRELLAHYDRVVVEADHFGAAPSSPRAQVLAYVSVGEVQPTRSWYGDVPRGLVVGRNGSWGSEIVDTKSPEWHAFLLDRVIEPLWARGYRGFFFDTLDSYERIGSERSHHDAHARAIGRMITTLQQRHRDVTVVVNRGFAVLPYVPRIDGLVVESLLATCDPSGRGCRAVPEAERAALLALLRGLRASRNVPITVVDYVPSADLPARRAIAKRIIELGFDPWVTSPRLDEYGIGRVEIVPRRILVVYKHDALGYLGVQDACVLLAPVLEWLGYAVDYADVRRPLPTQSLAGRYAGIVTLLPEGVEHPEAYRSWLGTQLDAGLRVAFVEGFGFDPDAAFLARLGLSAAKKAAKPPMKIASAMDYFGFEAPLRARARDLSPVLVSRGDVTELLRVEDADGAAWSGAVVGPWGGAAFMPYVIEERLEQERRWVLDPFKFLREALALPPIPAPDVTTESGRRILTAHIDGDAFVSRVERRGAPFTAQVILDEVLRRHHLPHTVSIVEGEVGATGMYPQHTAKLEAVARKIFALPNVEIASHTYSHPFEWEDAEAGKREPHVPHLPINGYTFDLERELRGSVAYINTLAPRDKRVKVMLWSGSCSPSARAVARAQELGLFNVNGGGATRTRDLPSLTRGSAMGIPKAPGVYQVFAPVENENVYTNDWLGPFDGYRHAVETFELNDSPRRLSPISIYYHFYSAAKTAALVGLESVYAWATKQESTPLFLSEYAAKVLAFQQASLARRADGRWEIGNLGELRTVRLDPALGWPAPGSVGVAGVRDAKQGRYVHLTDERESGLAVLAVGPSVAALPRLLHANGRVRRWSATGPETTRVRVAGHVPLEIVVAARKRCRLFVGGRSVGAVRAPSLPTGEIVTAFALPASDTGEAELVCR
jgi:polysaccharide biosynthesis protein PelA